MHDHEHPVSRADNSRRMAAALAINVVLLVAGVVGYAAFGSLALLADAGHVLTDVGAIVVGLFAARAAMRPPVAAADLRLRPQRDPRRAVERRDCSSRSRRS